jgi:hypothetical protein
MAIHRIEAMLFPAAVILESATAGIYLKLASTTEYFFMNFICLILYHVYNSFIHSIW